MTARLLKLCLSPPRCLLSFLSILPTHSHPPPTVCSRAPGAASTADLASPTRVRTSSAAARAAPVTPFWRTNSTASSTCGDRRSGGGGRLGSGGGQWWQKAHQRGDRFQGVHGQACLRRWPRKHAGCKQQQQQPAPPHPTPSRPSQFPPAVTAHTIPPALAPCAGRPRVRS